MVSKKRRGASVDAATFTERLNRLFAVVYPPGRGPYRNAEVREALAGRGFAMSAPYLSQLRGGTRTSPSLKRPGSAGGSSYWISTRSWSVRCASQNASSYSVGGMSPR